MKHLTVLLIQALFFFLPHFAMAEGPTPDADDAKVSEANGVALKDVSTNVVNSAATIVRVLESTKSTNLAKARELQTKLQDYQKLQDSCASREKTTELICREKTNPALVQALPIIQGIVTAVGGAKDACSKFAQATDKLNKALLLYQATCASTKLTCQNACEKSAQNLKTANVGFEDIVKKEVVSLESKIAAAGANQSTALYEQDIRTLNRVKTELDTNAKIDLDKSNSQSVTSNLETCSGFDKQLTSAMIGIVGVVKSMGESNNCDKKLSTTPIPTPTPIDCNLDVNKARQDCICKLNLRAVGCTTGLNNPTNAKQTGSGIGTEVQNGGGTEADPPIAGGGGSPEEKAKEKSGGGGGTGAPGAPVGGSAGIDGGGGLSGTGPAGSQKAGTRLNANIYGGDSGGGGGGNGGWGGDGGGGDGNPAMRKYLPGGEKDPNALAGKGAQPAPWAPKDGKSNWERVRERYIENKPTLLGY